MNRNLKNRPKYSSFGEPDESVKRVIDDYNKWFEGFEKELREMKQKHSPKLEVKLHTILKEILGE